MAILSDIFGNTNNFSPASDGLGGAVRQSPNNAGYTVDVGKTSENSASTGSNSFPIQPSIFDHRARLNIKPNDLSKLTAPQDQNKGVKYTTNNEYVLGNREDRSNILYPLFSTNGVLYPYTPDVSTSHDATYTPQNYTHSNYAQQAYQYSDIPQIIVTGTFTSQTNNEALYTLAVIHFFRTVTKMYFANPTGKVGAPPPVLLFNYLGDIYHNVPVVVTNFVPTFGKDNDIVTVDYGGGQASVPVEMSISVTLKTQYNPYNIKNEFNLDEFRTGKLLKRGYI